MPLSLRRGRVTAIQEQHEGLVRLEVDGETITEPEDLERVAELGIPPAWKDVWICPDARGHLQATGIDAAGRKQYLYHPQWRTRRDSEKFEEMTRFARALPGLREHVDADLGGVPSCEGKTRPITAISKVEDLA